MASKKKKAEEEEKPTGLAALMESQVIGAVGKKYGTSVYKKGSEAADMHRISSGILQLDKHLGGGWAVGYFHLLYGKESGGKTTTSLRTIGIAQKTCRNCYVLPFEPGECGCGNFEPLVCGYIRLEEFDKRWATARGINLDELFLAEPYYEEEALDIAEALVLSGECDLFVIDSIAFMTPQKEIEDSVAKDNPALQARQLGKGVRKLGAALTKVSREPQARRPTIFFTNQIRFKVGVVFGSPETRPGGQAPNFAAGSSVRFGSTKYKGIEGGEGAVKEGRAVYGDFPFKVEKNKTEDARGEGIFRQMIANGEFKKKGDVYDEHYILSQLRAYDLIKGSGKAGTSAPFYLLDEKYKSYAAIEERLVKDRRFHFEMRHLLMTIWAKERDPEYSAAAAVIEAEDPGMEVGAGE